MAILAVNARRSREASALRCVPNCRICLHFCPRLRRPCHVGKKIDILFRDMLIVMNHVNVVVE